VTTYLQELQQKFYTHLPTAPRVLRIRSIEYSSDHLNDNSYRGDYKLRRSSLRNVQASFCFIPHNIGNDHVGKVRIRLWTAAINGPIVHTPGDTRAWITMVEWCWQRKTPDLSTPELPDNTTSSHLVTSWRIGRRERWILLWKVFLFVRASDFLQSLKCYDMGPTALLPSPKEGVFLILSPFKIYHLGRVWIHEPWI
jgi:hypothetical protein